MVDLKSIHVLLKVCHDLTSICFSGLVCRFSFCSMSLFPVLRTFSSAPCSLARVSYLHKMLSSVYSHLPHCLGPGEILYFTGVLNFYLYFCFEIAFNLMLLTCLSMPSQNFCYSFIKPHDYPLTETYYSR